MSDQGKTSVGDADQQRRSGQRRKGRNGRRGRNSVSRYKRHLDERLFGKKEDQPRLRLEERIRATHGGPNFMRTYREYVKAHGMPSGIPLLLLLLDLDDEREKVRVVEKLSSVAADASLEQRNLLRSRLRNLERSASSDALADAASTLLAEL